MTEEAAPIVGREPFEPPPIRATFHINQHQGIGVPDSLIPKGEDGKPVPPAPDPIVDRRIESFRAQGVDEAVLEQVRAGTPVSEREFNLAQHRLAALKKDPAWVRSYLDGDVEKRKVMATLSIILGSQIKKEESNG